MRVLLDTNIVLDSLFQWIRSISRAHLVSGRVVGGVAAAETMI
jgi:hypothetical protein